MTIRMIKGGVITGRVTSESGTAGVGIHVTATRLRDSEGHPARFNPLDMWGQALQWKTDDRGIYRVYGLEPGVYVVSAGGGELFAFASGSRGGYDDDSPVFYPSNTRDTATEITLHGGDESSGIDISFREAKCHAVTGIITG